MPIAAVTTLASLLALRAEQTPDRPFIVMDRGDSRTYGEFDREVNRLAGGLAEAGVGKGARVALMLNNSLSYLRTSFALRKLGAVEVSIHTRARGAMLAHLLRVSEPSLIVSEDEFLPVLGEVSEAAADAGFVVIGDPEAASARLPGRSVVSFEELESGSEEAPGLLVRDTDLASVLFTSGTTGPSKGCMLSHRAALSMGRVIVEALGLTGEDCLYCPFPMSHVDSPYLTVGPALVTGGRAALGRRFSTSRYWDEVRELGATVFDFMGATLTMLWNQEPREDDADNPVRLAWGAPIPAFGPEFERRFGLRLVSGYGSTEAGIVTWCEPGVDEPFGSCGYPRSPYEIRIADPHDDPVPDGEVGEILVRTSEADVLMKGYLGMPEATVEVFRNQWLHTGDYGRIGEGGRLFFEGRKSESIRRRGENISSWEIEQVLESHPDVLEAVAIGIPSELTEEDVHAFVVPFQEGALAGEDLLDFCRARMADFMVPEQILFLPEIPKTDTGKPEKFKLRELAGG